LNNFYIERATLFTREPGYWKDKGNQKKFFDQLASKLNIRNNDDWNKVTTRAVRKEGGDYFINQYYNGSLKQGMLSKKLFLILKALQAVYPDYVPTANPRGFWKDKENQKKFFDRLAIKWNIQKPEDWRKVTYDTVLKEGGRFVARYYSGSIQEGTDCNVIDLTFKALQAVYPAYIPTPQSRVYWKNKENQKNFFDQMAIKWNIQKPEDWNNVTVEMVVKEGGGRFLKSYHKNSLQRGLQQGTA
jgi:hypothetical protein